LDKDAHACASGAAVACYAVTSGQQSSYRSSEAAALLGPST